MYVDGEGARRLLRSSRSSIVITVLSTLLLASLIGNIQQYSLLEHYCLHIATEERPETVQAACAQTEQGNAQKTKKLNDSVADRRLQQLYREIDNLSRMNEQILAEPLNPRRMPPNTAGMNETDHIQ
jgi:hypothetical protein